MYIIYNYTRFNVILQVVIMRLLIYVLNYFLTHIVHTSSTAQGGGGSFKDTKSTQERWVVATHGWQSEPPDGSKGGWGRGSESLSLCLCLCSYLSTHLPTDLSVCLSFCLSVFPSICLSVYLFIYLSIYLYLYFSFFLKGSNYARRLSKVEVGKSKTKQACNSSSKQ